MLNPNKGQFKKGHKPLFKGNPLYKKCEVCGKEFRTYPSKIAMGRGKYCSKECSMKITNQKLSENGEHTRFEKGQKAWNKRGFTYTMARMGGRAYKLIFFPEHPNSSKKGYVREHRLIMEDSIGRYLSRNEVVHHINNDTLDNNINNLELLTQEEHRRLHLKDNVHRRWAIKSSAFPL